MDRSEPVLTIAMPVFNEDPVIEQTVNEALSVLDDLGESGEVLVIDDGSTDRTPAILATIAKRDERLRVIRNEENRGISRFNRQMMENARGQWVFFIGSDGEWSCSEAIRFLQVAREEALDGVLGYRVKKHYGLWRRVISSSFNTLVFILFGAKFRDIGSIRLLRRSMFSVIPLYSRSAFLNAERLLVGRKLGAKLHELPVNHRERLAGKGKGASIGKVGASLTDLIRTRKRWLRFDLHYRSRG